MIIKTVLSSALIVGTILTGVYVDKEFLSLTESVSNLQENTQTQEDCDRMLFDEETGDILHYSEFIANMNYLTQGEYEFDSYNDTPLEIYVEMYLADCDTYTAEQLMVEFEDYNTEIAMPNFEQRNVDRNFSIVEDGKIVHMSNIEKPNRITSAFLDKYLEAHND